MSRKEIIKEIDERLASLKAGLHHVMAAAEEVGRVSKPFFFTNRIDELETLRAVIVRNNQANKFNRGDYK